MSELSIQELQETLPWNNPSKDQQGLHAMLHIVKAAAKLAMVFEEAGHDRPSGLKPSEIEALKAPCADVVICAARLAKVEGFALETAVVERVREKNPGCQFANVEEEEVHDEKQCKRLGGACRGREVG